MAMATDAQAAPRPAPAFLAAGAFGRAAWREVAVLAAPALLLFGIFIVLPFVLAVAASFSNAKLLQGGQAAWVGLAQYGRLFGMHVVTVAPEADKTPMRQWRELRRASASMHEGYQYLASAELGGRRWIVAARDPQFLRAVANTFWFALLVVPLQTVLALAMALAVNRSFPGRTLLRTVFFAPVVTSMVVVSVVWGLLLHTDEGLVNRALMALLGAGAPQPDWLGDARLAMPSIAIMSAWQGAGFQMLVFLAGLQSIPKELYEAAQVEGATRWQQFVHVTLPGLRRTLVFVLLATTIAAFGLFTQVDVLTKGGPLDATTTIMHRAVQVGVRDQDVAYGSAMALVFFVLVLALSLAQKRVLARMDR
ncbi:carbohydrate ABC transporter permease [Aquabacterium sp.]|uniref:carbohydrate ABC transporter permease n=1 Tax=Aquabacterium sp. TaxID=1872578 RepID=UPI002CFDBAC6|nr:sugar ABC transporter permease [Aquabacterium sp.]HSW08320.1 sugar ABC transporter permease [Aquabacterium sp.]